MKAKVKPTVQYERVALHERIPLATLLVVYIEPSGFCNFKCIFCPQGSGGRELKKDLMTTDLFRKLIDDLSFEKLLEHIDALYDCKGKCLIHIKITDKTVLPKERKTMFLDTFGDRCDEIYIEKLVPMWPQFDNACSPDTFRWDGTPVKHYICAQIFKGVQVQADGEVVSCCVDWKRVNVFGNIDKNSLYEIWNGEKLRRLQIEHLIGNKSRAKIAL
jgi:MoaA/NifB/PqqE/SkfB family radical SAM enzyme